MSLRIPFSQINPEAYLYPNKVKTAGDRKQAEEPVRQWCAHELIRAYGISIASIELERAVRMGSRPHWIDILVSCKGKPVVVVECKRPSERNLKEGMAQALSYADAPEIGAEFVVVTNGTDWQVRRRIQGKWCVVPDLPREIDQNGKEPITELLRGLQAVAPLLYRLNETLAGPDSQRFLDAMQQFFYGVNLLTGDIDPDLLIATDNLLRVMSLADEHPNYRFGKLSAAVQHFETYRNRKGIEREIFLSGETIPHEIQYLHASLVEITEVAQGISAGEVFLLRLDTALAEYGMRQGRRGESYPEIGPSLHTTLRDYLNYALTFHLNVSLPDHLDDIWIGDMRSYCRLAWEQLQVNDRITLWEFFSAWGSIIFAKIQFWRKRTAL